MMSKTLLSLPAKLQPEAITAICDTREKLPLDLSPLTVVRGTLQTGDYSGKGLEDYIAIERKSLQDLVMCVGRERERFEREVQRLMAYPCRLVVVEATWEQVESGGWRGRVTPSQVVGSLAGWQAKGLPINMAGDAKRAGKIVSRMIYVAGQRRWRHAREFVGEVMGE